MFFAVAATAVFHLALAQGRPADRVVRPKRVPVDWAQVARDAMALSPEFAAPSPPASGRAKRRSARAAKRLAGYTVRNGMMPLALLNEVTAIRYPGIGTAPVPVLAPLDVARLLQSGVGAGRKSSGAGGGLARSIEEMQLDASSSGYDIVARVSASLLDELGVKSSYRPQIQIGGSAVSYGKNQIGDLVADMQDVIPGLRRIAGDQSVTYVFRKYEVPYFVDMDCVREPNDKGHITCAEASRIAVAIVRDLRLSGGGPLPFRQRASAQRPQPQAVSSDFQYFAPGQLLEGTSADNMGGSPSRAIYGMDILFPLQNAPAYANSQVFMHGGDCLGKKVPLPKQTGDKFARYHCQQNNKQLLMWEGHPENYSYPWRDILCEARDRTGPVECPARKGHEGQDIRPSNCVPDPKQPHTCTIDRFPVVAVTNGKAWWKEPPFENHLRLNSEDGSGLYFMYLHMSPKALAAAGMKKGKKVPVARGRVIGKVGNYLMATPSDTTAHLHFEIRRLQGDIEAVGPSLSPYMTLVRAYERLIGASGKELP